MLVCVRAHARRVCLRARTPEYKAVLQLLSTRTGALVMKVRALWAEASAIHTAVQELPCKAGHVLHACALAVRCGVGGATGAGGRHELGPNTG